MKTFIFAQRLSSQKLSALFPLLKFCFDASLAFNFLIRIKDMNVLVDLIFFSSFLISRFLSQQWSHASGNFKLKIPLDPCLNLWQLVCVASQMVRISAPPLFNFAT